MLGLSAIALVLCAVVIILGILVAAALGRRRGGMVWVKPCPTCGRTVLITYAVCPECGTSLPH